MFTYHLAQFNIGRIRARVPFEKPGGDISLRRELTNLRMKPPASGRRRPYAAAKARFVRGRVEGSTQ